MTKSNNGEFTIRQARASIPNVENFLRELMVVASADHVRIVCLDADKMAGKGHVEAAVRHAIRAFSNCSNIADSLEMETLLYAAGTRQCSVGVKVGVHVGNNNLYICIIPLQIM
jgi:KEOPS complex subunit Cgi121